MTAAPLTLPLAEARDVQWVGGKAVNLNRLLQAGLPVPDGFVITTEAFRQADGNGIIPQPLAAEIRQRYESLGNPPVAVRSSATAEDLADASMAGQYDTILDVRDIEAVLEAVRTCWQSLQNARVQTYLREQGIDAKSVAVAVVVQSLVPAEVAGVLFTANPRTGAADEMVIEAIYGLGEGLVSGEVHPDVYRLDSREGKLLEMSVADKRKALRPGNRTYQAVRSDLEGRACLNHQQLQNLRDLGLRAQAHFGDPQDIEWALAAGKLYLLQSRAITTLAETRAYRALLEETRVTLAEALSAGEGPWVRHNLGETLPLPTPLTWSLIEPFMSGSGGFGRMHERLGFSPSDAIRKGGFLRLIAGQIYMDCRRLPEMFCADYPYGYDMAALRRNPDAAQQPPTVPKGSYTQMATAARLGKTVTDNLRKLAETLDQEFDEVFVSRVTDWCDAQANLSLTSLTDKDLIALWLAQVKTVFDDFGERVFLPSMVEALATADLKAFLREHIWDEDPDHLVQLLSVSPTPDVTLRSNVELEELARGERTWEAWLAAYGDRGPGEFDLASPRWHERREELEEMAKPLADAPSVSERHQSRLRQAAHCLARLEGELDPVQGATLEDLVNLVQRYVRFREDGKAVLMRAFAHLRRTALEFARRLELDDAVFFLQSEELCTALKQRFVPQGRIEERRLLHRAAPRISLPHVIEERDLATLGAPQIAEDVDCLAAFPVASGTAKGPARIVLDPTHTQKLGDDYILVCPSTDPAWTPLFVKAAGLVLERGGALSHGAIVAREMGLPAVVLENACTLLHEGETLTVDGNQGRVGRSGALAARDAAAPDPEDTHIPYAQRLPPPGRKEARANRQGLVAAILWGLLLAAMYLVPAAWIKEPVFGLIDLLLWPWVRGIGMVGTVMLVGAFFAIVPLVIQRFAFDNNRLWAAKQRAAVLQKNATAFPQGSPRRQALLAAAAPVTLRTLKASMAALAWVLGPMMVVFLWMPERLDPAAWNADPGGLVTVVAELDGDCQEPVTCDVATPLMLENTTPAQQTLPPIRTTLEDLRREWQPSADLSDYPWQLQTAGDQAQEILLGSLNAFLAGPIPPQKLSWMIRVPKDAQGHYPVTLSLPDQNRQRLTLAFGDHSPPTESTITGDNNPFIQVEAVYPRPLTQRRFWTPLKSIGGPQWDYGWLGAYIVSYLLVMLAVKKILRVA